MGIELQQVTVDLGDKCPEHKKMVVFILSLLQVVLGALEFAFFIGLVVVSAWPYASGLGFWGGILFMATGAVGIVAYHLTKMVWVVSSIGLSAISAIFAFAFFIVHAVGTAKYDYTCPSGIMFTKEVCRRIQQTPVAMNAILMLVCLALLIVCVVLVVFSVLSVIRHMENVEKSRYHARDTNHEVPNNDTHEMGHDNAAVTVNEDKKTDSEKANKGDNV